MRDKSGAFLAGAEVDIVSEATGVHQITVSNQSGLFQLQALNPGLYTVVVQEKGFETEASEPRRDRSASPA